MIKLKLDVTGHYCNRWPTIVIWHNDKQVYTNIIENDQQIEISLNAKVNFINTLAVGMRGKQFGKDGIYDTVVSDGKITEDLQIKINSVSLDDIPILDLLIKNDYHIDIVEGMDHKHTESISQKQCKLYLENSSSCHSISSLVNFLSIAHRILSDPVSTPT